MPESSHSAKGPRPRDHRADGSVDRAALAAVIEPVVRAHGGEVVDIEWKQEGSGWFLRIFVEKLGSAAANATTENAAISLEVCAGIARDVSPALDVADLIASKYNLEVGSPGVERPLRTEKDYARFVGQKAKLKVREPVLGQKVVVGVLEGPPTDGSVSVRDGSKLRSVLLDNVVAAHLVFEFGPTPRPAKGSTKPVPWQGKPQKSPRKAEAGELPPSDPTRSGEPSNS